MMRLVSRIVLPVLALLALGVGGGCATQIPDPVLMGPFFEPKNVVRDVTLGGIRRVVLMPVWAGATATEESAADLDPVFRQALQDQNRFEVVTLSRAECRNRFGATALSSAAAVPNNLIATIQKVYAADAIMFVDVTVHRPYHPLALGIRSRLVVVNNSHLAWAFDNVFSADDPLVSASARHYYIESEHQGVPGDLTPAVLQSPSRFATYAAHATFDTLPPVTLGRFPESSAGQR